MLRFVAIVAWVLTWVAPSSLLVTFASPTLKSVTVVADNCWATEVVSVDSWRIPAEIAANASEPDVAALMAPTTTSELESGERQ